LIQIEKFLPLRLAIWAVCASAREASRLSSKTASKLAA
jgi:hypothetical protein